MKTYKLKREIVISLSLILLLGGLVYYFKNFEDIYAMESRDMTASYDTSSHVYLSDIQYEDESYVKPGNYFRLDKNSQSGLITLKVNGKSTPFIKGISAWATSEIIYDLSKYPGYDYFTAYLGVDLSQTNDYFNGGVTFYIYTSNDGVEWTEAFKTNSMRNQTALDTPEAVYAEVDIRGAKYLKLYAYENGNSWYSHWYDDAVYADAMLVTSEYKDNNKTFEVDNLVKELSYYDNIIKEKYTKCVTDNSCSEEELKSYNLTLLQRDFVSKVGYDILQSLLHYSSEYHTILDWLMNDADTLELFLLGGSPDGNYVSSLKLLNELYKKYQNDFNIKDLTKTNKDKTVGELYKEIAITLSLTHSANVGLWVTGAPEDSLDPNGSYAIDRYAIYKELYTNNKLDNNIFENLSVEEMRFVMNNIIDDEEIMWLNEFVRDNDSTDPYKYITYTFDYDYSKEQYYDQNRESEWNNKTRNNLKRPYTFNAKYTDANGKSYSITYGYKAKLWIVFEEGSVCGGLSKTGSNIWGTKGVPSSVISQPGHAAYIYMALKDNQKVWNLGNNVSGWGQSGKTEKLSVRMPNGWGSGSYAGGWPASYVLLAQTALSEYDKYVEAEKVLMLADVYKDDYDKLNSIYEKAVDIEKINFDAWYGLVNLYLNNGASEDKLLELAKRIVDNLVYYPLPMHDLLRLIDTGITSEANEAQIINLIGEALNKSKNVTESEYIQASATNAVANYLLSNHKPIATFSFDGDDANKIVLEERFKDTDVKWEYNLVSALPNDNNWKNAEGISHELTEEELAQIHEETDIHLKISGSETIYDINIEKSDVPLRVENNDNENIITGTDETMEWKTGNSGWTSFKDSEPNLEGNVTINIRVGYTANKIASEPVTLEFTDADSNVKRSYIKASKLSVVDASSEELSRSKDAKENILDGNKNTMWHTLWDGSDTQKYITLKLEEPSYVSALEYVPRANSTNGIVKVAKIEVSEDGSTWDQVETTEDLNWNADNTTKTANFKESTKAQYVKLTGVETVGSYMSASMINLFEDTTKKTPPTAEIEYSTKELTNKDVTVKLVNSNRHLTITNNKGSDTYTFTKNGSFTFEFKDDYGNTGKVTANVDWIDKVSPVAVVRYTPSSATNSSVTAFIYCKDEDIYITNNDGKNSYKFEENGSFTFEYKDKAGNTNKTTAKVTWIEKDIQDNKEENKDQESENKDNNVVVTPPISNNTGNNSGSNPSNNLQNNDKNTSSNVGNIDSSNVENSEIKDNKDESTNIESNDEEENTDDIEIGTISNKKDILREKFQDGKIFKVTMASILVITGIATINFVIKKR